MSPPRVITVGEALVDWISTERGADLAAATAFTKAAGGAPLNVAVGLARLGVPAAFAGRLGDDAFGAWLGGVLAEAGVNGSLARVAPGRPTRMAYVVTDAGGDRHLAAFSRDAADEALGPDDLPAADLAHFDAMAFGSLILLAPGPREAVLAAARAFRARGGLVLFDPNPRPTLWPDDAALRAAVEAGLGACDLLKVGQDELAWLTSDEDAGHAAEALRARHGLAGVLVTCGPAGAFLQLGPDRVVAEAACEVDVVDATGAGDGFVAGLLAGLPDGQGWRTLDDDGWGVVLRLGCAVGGLACTRAGAVTAMPTSAELAAFLAG